MEVEAPILVKEPPWLVVSSNSARQIQKYGSVSYLGLQNLFNDFLYIVGAPSPIRQHNPESVVRNLKKWPSTVARLLFPWRQMPFLPHSTHNTIFIIRRKNRADLPELIQTTNSIHLRWPTLASYPPHSGPWAYSFASSSHSPAQSGADTINMPCCAHKFIIQ